MSTEEVENGHQEGPPWKIVGKFPTFEGANAKREKLFEEVDLQVKIHYQGPPDRRYYAVKTRVDPAIAAAEEVVLRREAKKRRKAKLNKKRRKK